MVQGGDIAATDAMLGRLTPKQREVMDLILDHRSNKEIARRLGVSESAVEQRVSGAQRVLGTHSRAESARVYECLLAPLGKTTGGFPQVNPPPIIALPTPSDGELEKLFALAEMHSPARDGSAWGGRPPGEPFLEAWDRKYGKIGRLALIIGLAVLVVTLTLLSVSLANGLDTVLKAHAASSR